MRLTVADLHESLEMVVVDFSQRWEKPVIIVDGDGVSHHVHRVVHRAGSVELHVERTPA